MPSSTATINKDQRLALYELVRNHLGGLGDVWIAMEAKGDYATAERLAMEFNEDFRLLADLGWDREDSREVVELTMPREDLTGALKRIRSEAEGGVGGSESDREQREAEEKVNAHFRLARSTCEELLTRLDA
jgi:hypothetical protein